MTPFAHLVENLSIRILVKGRLDSSPLNLINELIETAPTDDVRRQAERLRELASASAPTHAGYEEALKILESITRVAQSSDTSERGSKTRRKLNPIVTDEQPLIGSRPSIAAVPDPSPEPEPTPELYTKTASKPESGSIDAVATELSYDVSHGAEILESFFSEVTTHLQTVEQQLLHLERHPSDRAALDAVFGAMHSLKGITGFLDATIARQLAHEAEAVMDRARTRTSGKGITRPECDVILRAVDVLREIAERMQEHSKRPDEPFPEVPLQCAPLLDELHGLAMASGLYRGLSGEGETRKNANATGLMAAIPTPPEALPPVPDRAPKTRSGSAPAEAPPAAPTPPIPDARRATRMMAEPPAPPAVARSVTARIEQDAVERGAKSGGLVRVQVRKLDNLLDAIGELVVMQSQVKHDPDLQTIDDARLSSNLSRLDKITRDLQSLGLSLRMYPLRDTFARMTRLARDLAVRVGKDVDIEISGENTEMDKNVIEALVDPLMHLVRNAVDHGVGSPADRAALGKDARGTVHLAAWHQGGHVMVEVGDDGRGLNAEKIVAKARDRGLIKEDEDLDEEQIHELIFKPGFSTAEKVTDISGRGVGLDVVRSNVESLGGFVRVSSRAGEGTRFTLSLPLTLAIVDGLVVRSGPERYIVPLSSVIESLRPKRDAVSTVHGRGEVLTLREEVIPIVRLHAFAGIKPDILDPWRGIVTIVESRGQRYALFVDELLGQQQVVIKNLGQRLSFVRGVSGGAILGDGRVGLILDVPEVLAAMRYRSAAASALFDAVIDPPNPPISTL